MIIGSGDCKVVIETRRTRSIKNSFFPEKVKNFTYKNIKEKST